MNADYKLFKAFAKLYTKSILNRADEKDLKLKRFYQKILNVNVIGE